MMRTTSSIATHRRRKRLMKLAKGFWGDRKNHIRQTSNAVMKALAYNYIHRKKKKSDFRALWIQRVSVAAKIQGLSYSKFINGLILAGCKLNRKVLSEMAISDPQSFAAVASLAKAALA
ncbi:MAG: 50S ribosomal protein L20 [Chlamydiae bacterium]|nr:50S ribosomal protein L20 [Chlamydiota bacterium]